MRRKTPLLAWLRHSKRWLAHGSLFLKAEHVSPGIQALGLREARAPRVHVT